MKSLAYCENPSNNPLQEAIGFPVDACEKSLELVMLLKKHAQTLYTLFSFL